MLAVDIGNTFIRIVAFAGERVASRLSLHTHGAKLAEISAAFAEAAAAADTAKAWIASVAPPVNALVDAAAQKTGLARRFIRSGTDFILPHTLSTPETTGVDRLLAALSAKARHFADAPGCVVAQCGSAATVDLVDAGVFRGGYILPGPAMWLGGMARGAQLPDYSGELPDWRARAIGANTRDAMVNGMHLALPTTVAAVAGLVAADGGLPLAVTGGWGEAVLPHLRSRHIYDKDLVLHGIRLFASMND